MPRHYSQEQAKYRVSIKRQLKAAAYPFDPEESTELLELRLKDLLNGGDGSDLTLPEKTSLEEWVVGDKISKNADEAYVVYYIEQNENPKKRKVYASRPGTITSSIVVSDTIDYLQEEGYRKVN